ncbi:MULTISPECIES: MATE family efflux transporter [unclassified Oceanispirochaeta]|uniref:MATE family efflux transporter n=1 Tax=unclassified Oceanispirochaeta TaxID=2635722 RepID=UPI0013147F98|nr:MULTISPECIES: MATE family efflux transporter [unclassified Oceanispirochaeta]MBF9013992.1 MATE family efflux transporter [Oceanispirochaeta sp. M2]NPD70483.1 MATE family efflux transporter [Oceanispirochaeta sp. M1]
MKTIAQKNTKQIRTEIIILILPIILENILQLSAGVISTAMIGRLTAADISGQGICLRLTDTLWCLYKGIGIGATILIARAYGEGNNRKVDHITVQTFRTAVPLSILFALILFLTPLTFLQFFTSNPSILKQALLFMRIIIFGFPFVITMQIVTASFQGRGDTKTPMFIALLVNLVNIISGYLLIFGSLGFPAMGIQGAAISLVLSQAAGAGAGVYLLYGRRGQLNLKNRNKESSFLDKNMIAKIYHMGLPASFESMFWQFSAIILSKIILSYGEGPFAAYQLGIQAETLTEMPAIGFGIAATTLTARAIGMKDPELYKQYFKQLLQLSLGISVGTSLLLITMPGVFMSLMTDNPELKAIGILYVAIMGTIQIPQNLSRIFNGAIRAAGYSRIPMYIAGAGIWGFRIPLALLTAYVFHWDLVFIWLCIAVDQIMRFILSILVYKNKRIAHFINREPSIPVKGNIAL